MLNLYSHTPEGCDCTLGVGRGSSDADDVTLVLSRRDLNVDIVLRHHLAHILTLLANNKAMVPVGYI